MHAARISAVLAMMLLGSVSSVSPGSAGPAPCADGLEVQWLREVPAASSSRSGCQADVPDASSTYEGIPIWCWINDDDSGASRDEEPGTDWPGPNVRMRQYVRIFCYNQHAPNYFAGIPLLHIEGARTATWCEPGDVGEPLFDCTQWVGPDSADVHWQRDEFCIPVAPNPKGLLIDCAADWFIGRYHGFSFPYWTSGSVVSRFPSSGDAILESRYTLRVPKANGYVLLPDNSVVSDASAGCDKVAVDKDGNEDLLSCWTRRVVPVPAYQPYPKPPPTEDPAGYVHYCVRDPDPPRTPCP